MSKLQVGTSVSQRTLLENFYIYSFSETLFICLTATSGDGQGSFMVLKSEIIPGGLERAYAVLVIKPGSIRCKAIALCYKETETLMSSG